MLRPPTVNAGNVHPCTCQLTRPSMDACTLISSTCPAPLLCVQFKVSFPPSPTTSLPPHFSQMQSRWSALLSIKIQGGAKPLPEYPTSAPHLPSANKKGGVAFLTANYAHNKSIEQSHYLSVRASTDGRASCLVHGCTLTA